jgi:putative transposase
MPSHYHFLLRPEEDGLLSRFIQRLFNSYTQAFNKQQGRSGTLFEGRAKSVRVDTDEYVLHLCRYIHLNPVRAGLVAHPAE